MTEQNMTYASTGVDYDSMDPFKRMAQIAARETAHNIPRYAPKGFAEFEPSRGESAYLIETPDSYLAHVEEGLGTKNLVADAMYKLTGKSYYGSIAQCTVAMIVNDLVTLGARPLSVAMHLAAGSSDWFKDEKRAQDLVRGWKYACNVAECAWGGGETPTLKGIVYPDTVVLSGSAIGIVEPKNRLLMPTKIREGDKIIMFASSGIHANGLTLARTVTDKLPEGYLTKLSDGRTYGETLLDPTMIYVDVVCELLKLGIDIHYAVNITGHGWRKLMRAVQPFTYVIDTLPPQLPIFDFIQKHGPVSDEEVYGNFNMGAGFALYVPEQSVSHTLKVSNSLGHTAFVAGHIEKGPKRVLIKPKNIEFAGETLAVR